MRLLLHQFKKDFYHTWIIWALWLFFVLVQFGLAAWTVNPGDLLATGIYGQIISMVPAIHAILLFVLIPLLVFQETPVGTTASWLSRPMPPLTVLGSKLISFGILVLVPLLGQCFVLASHHVVLGDVVLAGIEIALKELSWIALATGLAVLCPNFGAFMVAAAALYVLQYFSGWIWNWIALIHPRPPSMAPAPQTFFLVQSRLVASDVVCIVFGFGVVFSQYITRRTRLAVVIGILGLVVSASVSQYWPWDFVNLLADKPASAAPPTVSAPTHLQPTNSHGISGQTDARGTLISQSLMVQFVAPGLPPEENLSLQSEGGEQAFPDGSKLDLKPRPDAPSNNFAPSMVFNDFRGFGYNGTNVAALDAAIGNFPILNQQFNFNNSFAVEDLFTVDSGTFSKRGTDLGAAEFQLKGSLSGYRITAEIPLVKGAFFSDGSKRTTLTEILRTEDGVNLVFRARSLNLLLSPAYPENPGAQPIYFLLNRKRSEALGVDGNGNGYGNFYNGYAPPNGLMSVFNVDDNHFEVFTGMTLAFHSQEMPPHPLPVPIDDAWVADAKLVRLEPVQHGVFTTTVQFPDFALDGHTLTDPNDGRSGEPDLEALKKITLPAHPTRAEVWSYITHILFLSTGQRNSNPDDPQVEMLARVGPEHATDLLIATGAFSYNGYSYAHLALKSLDLRNQADAKAMIFRLLLQRNDLLEFVVDNHWVAEAKPILLERLARRQPGENIDDAWLDALAQLRDDPQVKQAILDLLPSQQNVIRIVIANHWELDAKPILISVIARTPPGSPIDDRWVQVLDSFHDDSKVKAMLLRVLPSDPDAIETVVDNHWEADAKPILIEALNKAKPGANIDGRWFTVLASLSDQSGVRDAVLRVLPFCHNAIGLVLEQHWEVQACPIILDTLAKARPGEAFDDQWFQALIPVSDRKDVKDTVLRLLPTISNSIVVVLDQHWEAEAKPIILNVLNKAKPGDNVDQRWYRALGASSDQSGVKAAVLRILPFVQGAAFFVIQQHWEAEARPVVIATLAAAKPDDNFDNQFISIAAGAPQMAGVKEAILHVLPRNQEAIEFILQNHWEADAEPILLPSLKKSLTVLGGGVNPRWIFALASAHDPTIYPLLLAYTRKKLEANSDWASVNFIRPLPGGMVAKLVGDVWHSMQQGKPAEIAALEPVTSWGFADALDRAASILSEPREKDVQKRFQQESDMSLAHQVFTGHTPCPEGLLDCDLAAWWNSHKALLGFEPGLGRFIYHPKPLAADQSWPTWDESMQILGRRAEAGDTAAFDEIAATMDRTTEGIDPKQDAAKIESIREALGSRAFDVLSTDVVKHPGILATLEAANRQPLLRPFIVGVYGTAAQDGNQDALQAMLNYQSHQWNLWDVVATLRGAVAKENPQVIAFEGNLPNDPNSTTKILSFAADELANPANGGNDQARSAYRAVRQALSKRNDL